MDAFEAEPSIRPVTGRDLHVKRRLALTVALTIVSVSQVLGQAPPVLPSLQPPPGSPIERVAPRQLPPVAPGSMNLGRPDAGEVPNVPIAVRQVNISGASLFDEELRPGLEGLRGPATSLTELNKARQGILLYYRTRGYPLVAVSLDVDRVNGIVTYRVTEGRIVDVKLEGDVGPAGEMILRILRHLTESPVIDAPTLERYLLLAQDVPGVSLSTVLNPSTTDPGALTLIAQVGRAGLKIPGVKYGSLSGQASLDNRAFYLTGPMEFLGILDVNALTAWGDKTELSYYHTFPNSQNFGQISTEFYLNSTGLRLRIYGGAGSNFPTGSLAALQYNGFTDIFGAQLGYPLIRTRQQSLNVYAAFDALESTIYTGTPNLQASADEIRALRIGEDFTRWDNLLGALWDKIRGDKAQSTSMPATNILSTRLSQGLEFLGGYHGTSLPPSTARQNEQHNFTAIRFEASRTQTLYIPWEGASLALMGLVTGQYTQAVLPPAEQFYLGGSRFTRGYYSGQVPGDKALAATAELQLNTTIDLSYFGTRADVASQFYLFYDWGEVWQNQESDFAARLASAGGGMRLQITAYAELDFEALARFTKRPPPATADMNGIGLFWRIVGRF